MVAIERLGNKITTNVKRKLFLTSLSTYYINFQHYVFKSIGFCMLWVMQHIFLHILTSHHKSPKIDWFIFYSPALFIAACAAVRL